MATDRREIKLTEEQRRLLAQRAEDTGRPWNELLDELFAKLPPRRQNPARSLYEALEERGMIGCYDGPGDLSTNPKHLEGFGESRNATHPD